MVYFWFTLLYIWSLAANITRLLFLLHGGYGVPYTVQRRVGERIGFPRIRQKKHKTNKFWHKTTTTAAHRSALHAPPSTTSPPPVTRQVIKAQSIDKTNKYIKEVDEQQHTSGRALAYLLAGPSVCVSLFVCLYSCLFWFVPLSCMRALLSCLP